MKKSWIILTTALVLALFVGCHNPIGDAVLDDPNHQKEQEELLQPNLPEEPTPEEKEAADQALREELTTLLAQKLGTRDEATGEEYCYSLGQRVTAADGEEYFYGRWEKIIHDLDSGKEVHSLMAEVFVTPDGKHAFVGNYFPENGENGSTVVLTQEDLFAEDPMMG